MISDDKKRLIIIILSGMALGELLPEPTDALYFWLQRWLEENKLALGDMQYLALMLFSYYCLSAIWYFALIGYFLLAEIEPSKSIFYFMGAIALGGVIGVGFMLAIDSPSFIQIIAMVAAVIIASLAGAAVISYYTKKRRRR